MTDFSSHKTIEKQVILTKNVPVTVNKAVSRVWCENFWHKIIGIKPCYRSEEEIKQVLLQSGFEIEAVESSGSGNKKCWVFAKLRKA